MPTEHLAGGAFDLKVFFDVVAKAPPEVTAADGLGFITAQRSGATGATPVAVIDGAKGGLSVRTVRRRLSSVSGLFAFLQARGDVSSNPVPRGLPTRRERTRPRQGVPLLRSPRTLPTVLSPEQVDALTGALRTNPGPGDGHHSMDMTLRYAKIANRTVADEYFAVTEKVEALYYSPVALPSHAAGPGMARLHREMHQRLLGHGYSTFTLSPPASHPPGPGHARCPRSLRR